MKTEKTHPKKKVQISLVSEGTIIGDKEILLNKKSDCEAVVANDDCVLYEIDGKVKKIFFLFFSSEIQKIDKIQRKIFRQCFQGKRNT